MSHDEEDIFEAAIAIGSEEARQQYLIEACGTDRALLSRLQRLLKAHSLSDSLLDGADLADHVIGLDSSEFAEPQRFGEFEILREVGRGGMGIVYEAFQRSLNRRVALKVLSIGFAFSKSALVRFQREAEAAARLHHSNIVPVYMTGTQDQIPYYAMELVSGPSLEYFIRQWRNQRNHVDQADDFEDRSQADGESDAASCSLTPPVGTGDTWPSRSQSLLRRAQYFDSVARIMAAAADALDHAHANSVIHRDIKPSNLLVSAGERVRITDFGLARIVDDPSVTVTGELMGSPRYMSPEQVTSSAGPLDHRTDIYSLGVTLYELLTTQPAFDGEQREHILQQVVHRDPVLPRRHDRSIPVDLETICMHAMEKSPDRRYQSAAEMADDLRRFLSRRSITARRIGPTGRALRWLRRNRLPATLGGALALSLLCGITFFAWSRIARLHAENQRFETARQEFEKLVQQHPWDAVLRLHLFKSQFPDKQNAIAQLQETVGRPIHVESDPPGAKIMVRPANLQTGRWLDAGTTPLTIQVPLESIHFSVTFPNRHEIITLQQIQDPSRDSCIFYRPNRPEMVSVPASTYEPWRDAWRLPWLNHRLMPDIPRFDLDQHEVTNAEYQAFVDDPRHLDKEFWEPTLGEHWCHQVRTFRDATGQIAPKFWLNGKYLAGSQNQPVVGVNWYEAMAYSLWSKKQLPTIYHWLRGASYDGFYDTPDYFQLSNIDNRLISSRTVEEGQLNVSEYGAMEMEGNVKEWCFNASGSNERYTMGASWKDAEGTMFDPVVTDAHERNVETGFRCAVYSDQPELLLPAPIHWRPLPQQPLPVETLKAPYEYDQSKPLNVKQLGLVPFEDLQAHAFEFDAAYGENERVTCYIILPDAKQFKPPYQVLLGSSPLEREDDGIVRVRAGSFRHYRPMLNAGRALALPALWGNDYTQANLPLFNTWIPDPNRLKEYEVGMLRVANDISRTADFICSYDTEVQRGVLNSREMGYVACGQTNTISAIVADGMVHGHDRFRAIFFCEGGMVNCDQPPTVDSLNFVPYLKVPTIMLVTKRCLSFPHLKMQKPLYDLIPLVDEETKKLITIPNYSFGLPPENIDREVNWFLGKYLPSRTR